MSQVNLIKRTVDPPVDRVQVDSQRVADNPAGLQVAGGQPTTYPNLRAD